MLCFWRPILGNVPDIFHKIRSEALGKKSKLWAFFCFWDNFFWNLDAETAPCSVPKNIPSKARNLRKQPSTSISKKGALKMQKTSIYFCRGFDLSLAHKFTENWTPLQIYFKLFDHKCRAAFPQRNTQSLFL